MHFNRVSFVFICYFSAFDVDSEPGTVIDAIGAHYDQVRILLNEATFSLITAIDPIECDQCGLKQDYESIIFKTPLIQNIPQDNVIEF